jgi:hypothetical protein
MQTTCELMVTLATFPHLRESSSPDAVPKHATLHSITRDFRHIRDRALLNLTWILATVSQSVVLMAAEVTFRVHETGQSLSTTMVTSTCFRETDH